MGPEGSKCEGPFYDAYCKCTAGCWNETAQKCDDPDAETPDEAAKEEKAKEEEQEKEVNEKVKDLGMSEEEAQELKEAMKEEEKQDKNKAEQCEIETGGTCKV